MIDFKKLKKVLKNQGWDVSKTKSGHYKMTPPANQGRIVYTGSTPSDKRHMKNLLSDLRKQGLKL